MCHEYPEFRALQKDSWECPISRKSYCITFLGRHTFQSGIPSFYGHFPCLKQCVPKAPYHSPVRCRIVRRLDGELIRARGSQNHRGTGYVAYSSSAKRQKHMEKTASARTNTYCSY